MQYKECDATGDSMKAEVWIKRKFVCITKKITTLLRGYFFKNVQLGILEFCPSSEKNPLVTIESS